jgi:hypothetical protein
MSPGGLGLCIVIGEVRPDVPDVLAMGIRLVEFEIDHQISKRKSLPRARTMRRTWVVQTRAFRNADMVPQRSSLPTAGSPTASNSDDLDYHERLSLHSFR